MKEEVEALESELSFLKATKSMEDEIVAAELELSTLQAEVSNIEVDIELYETELPRYRREIKLLEKETVAAVSELQHVQQQERQLEGLIDHRMTQTEIFCLKYYHNEILREAIYERNQLSKCQDKLIHCLEEWKIKMTRVPAIQKRLILLYKERRRLREEWEGYEKGDSENGNDDNKAAVENSSKDTDTATLILLHEERNRFLDESDPYDSDTSEDYGNDGAQTDDAIRGTDDAAEELFEI